MSHIALACCFIKLIMGTVVYFESHNPTFSVLNTHINSTKSATEISPQQMGNLLLFHLLKSKVPGCFW